MNAATGFVNQRLTPALTALSENTYLSAIRAGMVSIVPLTIIGGFFLIIAYFPSTRWEKIVAPHLQLLQVPVTATFGVLAVFVCFAIAYDLGKRLGQEAIVSATIATVVFAFEPDHGDAASSEWRARHVLSADCPIQHPPEILNGPIWFCTKTGFEMFKFADRA